MPKHLSAKLASTRHVEPSSTGQPVDTVPVSAGADVLLMGQNVSAYNGYYTVAAGQWQRHEDFSTAAQMEPGTTFYVRNGSEHKGGEFYLEEPVDLVDSTSLYFKRRSYAVPVRPGSGLEFDPGSTTLGLRDQAGVQGTYVNPSVTYDARGVAVATESGSFPEGLIEGLRPARLSATSVEISEGQAWIPGGEGALLVVDFPVTKTGLVLPASSTVYLYLWNNGGSPDVEFSTQPPDDPYYGAARAKSGAAPDFTPDETRRLIGRLQTDATGGVYGVLGHDAEGWIAPTLLNGWVNHGAPLETAGYHKDPLGYVHLKGVLKNGNGMVPILRLPAGYRPAAEKIFAAKTDSVNSGRLDVEADGDVLLQAGTNGYLSLASVSFRAEL